MQTLENEEGLETAKDLQFFLSRIGKRVRRNVGTCTCNSCRDVEKNGLIISDEQHAEYLFNCQMDRDSTGKWIVWNRYRDTEDVIDTGEVSS